MLTVVSFKTENGFANSGPLFGLFQPHEDQMLYNSSYNEQSQENWGDGGGLFGSW